MNSIKNFLDKYFIGISLPHVTLIDILEVLIIAFAIYHIVMWVKNTRAWMLVKGIVFLLVFFVVAMVLRMDVILWIFRNAISVGIIAVIIVFQPELRSALEQLGRRNVIASIFSSESVEDRITDRAITEIVKACARMSKEKTGALIVIENEIQLKEYENNGIYLNADISMQLLTNIFEHNTPLHDGATIIRDNKILTATCYLPLSDNMELSKDLGTRHRAAVGISEISDSLTIVVSEESGIISVARFGELKRNVDPDKLKNILLNFIGTDNTKNKKNIWRRKGGKNKV